MMKKYVFVIKSLEDLKELKEVYQKGIIKLNISKIARDLGKSRKTVRKHLNGEYGKERKQRKKYLDDYRDLIIKLLDDEYQEFLYMDHLYKYLCREHGISCSRATLNNYVRQDEIISQKFKKNKNKSFTVRFETASG